MLKHENNQETSSPPAAQARVTPEELATALSRVEARKDNGQRHVDGTISIGEAVQHLGVDATPEEVLAEVQAIRQEPTRTKGQQVSHRQRLALLSGIGLAGMGLGLIGLVGWWSVLHPAERQAEPAVAVNLADLPKPILLDPTLLVGDASGKVVMLPEVGDGQPVRCGYGGGAFQQYRPDGSESLWTLVKHDGRLYVRGRIPRMSEQALLTSGTDVTIADAVGFVVPVTLPLNGFQVTSGNGSDVEFHAVNIRLDKHAYEKWEP